MKTELLTALGLLSTQTMAVEPISVVIAFVGAYAGAVSMAANVDRNWQDYEQVKLQLFIHQHVEVEINGHASGDYAYTIRNFWVDWNGVGQYVQETGFNGERITYDSTPFQFNPQKGEHICPSVSGMAFFYRYATTVLSAGYDVLKYAGLARNCAPETIQADIRWDGVFLPRQCSDQSIPHHFLDVSAVGLPRNSRTYLTLPRDQSMILYQEIVPQPMNIQLPDQPLFGTDGTVQAP